MLRWKPDKTWLAFFGIFAVAGCMVITICLISGWGFVFHHGRPSGPGWSCEGHGEHSIVTAVNSAGPAFGKLERGDEIVLINGSERLARFAPVSPLVLPANSAHYSVDIVRHRKTIHVELRKDWSEEPEWVYLCYFFFTVLNLTLALWIGLARPDSPTARRASLVFMAVAWTFGIAVLFGVYPPLRGLLFGVCVLLSSLAWRALIWPLVFDYYLQYPEQIRQPRPLRVLRNLFYSIGVVLFACGLLPTLSLVLGLSSRVALFPSWLSVAAFDEAQKMLIDLMGALILCSIPPLLTFNYLKLPDRSARKRLQWVGVSTIVAGAPLAGGITARFIFTATGNATALENTQIYLDTFASFAVALFPLICTYAIIKHRIFGVRFAIRRSLQYLLANNILRIILYLPIIGLLADLALHPKESIENFFLNKSRWFYLFFIGTAFLSLRYRNRLRSWVDRRFFRSAYEEEVILAALIDSIQNCTSFNEVARQVAGLIRATLLPSEICVLVRLQSTDGFTGSGYGDNEVSERLRNLLGESEFRKLEAHQAPLTFKQLNADTNSSAMTVKDPVAPDPADALLVPIGSASSELLGVILLGERKSEEPYSTRDRKLLQSMAAQIALVLEVLNLKEQAREDKRVRVDVLGRLQQSDIRLLVECPTCGRCYSTPQTHCQHDKSALTFTLPIEQIISGKYRLERRIGSGGMGAVYAAIDIKLDRKVAVKVMTGRLFGNTVALRRFEREARSVARLQHHNIVALYDFGLVRDDGAYLVMQLLSGRSWRAILLAGEVIAPVRAAHWFDQLCDGMAYAHAHGIVHRDLKPENVIASSDGLERITIVDFGLAKHQAAEPQDQSQLSTESAVLGTYGYASPEQRAGTYIDARSDIYAMGIMLIEVLTRSRPPNFGATIAWADNVLPTASSHPALATLIGVLHRCLATEPEKRFDNVSQLQRELVPILRECPEIVKVRGASEVR